MYGIVYLPSKSLGTSGMFLASALEEKLNIKRMRTTQIREHLFDAITLPATYSTHASCNL